MLALRFPGDSNRVISDLKFKLVKAEQEATASEQNVSRGEGIQTGYSDIVVVFTTRVAFCFSR